MRPSFAVRLGALFVPLLVFFVCAVAHAQAPPPSFFDGRSNEDLRALAKDSHNDVLLRRTAATRLVTNLADAGDFDAADAAAREFAKNIDPAAPKHAKAVRRRGYVHVVALCAFGAILGIAAVSLALARRRISRAAAAVRRLAPFVVFFLVDAGLVGGYLATRYENGSPTPFVLFAALMLPLFVVFRSWSAVGSPRAVARALRAGAAVAATVALGFLVVEAVNPAYLEGFGL